MMVRILTQIFSFLQVDSSSLSVVRELPVLSLANPGMERIVDSSTSEYTSMLLNCRDGSLAQQLAHKLSIVANTATSM